jgi:hypothetical protein
MSCSSMFRMLLVCGLVVCAWTTANATFITTDGSFGNQSDGVAITSPWNYAQSGTAGSTASQSPFTNVFANTYAMGAYYSSDAAHYFAQSFTTIPANATGMRYLNADVMLASSNTGDFDITLSNASFGAGRSVRVYVHNTGIYAESGSGIGTSLLTPVVGKWYNIQLALDMTNNQYSGMITTEGTFAQTAISTRSFFNANCDISLLFSDTAVVSGLTGGNVACRADNWVLSDTPLAAPTPEPGALVLLGSALLGLLAYAWRRQR